MLVFPQKVLITWNFSYYIVRIFSQLIPSALLRCAFCHSRAKHITRTLKTYFLIPTLTSIKTTCLVQRNISQTLKKSEITLFATAWMDLEIVIRSEVSQTEKEKYHTTSLICGISKEMIQMNLLTKQKETHGLREGTHSCRGKDEGKG